jgi:hypothetical protein
MSAVPDGSACVVARFRSARRGTLEIMPNTIIRGIAAGALGTTALNMTTYLDMAIRGRPSSSVPEQDVQTLADRVGVDLTAGGSDEQAANRRQGLGALTGYLTGIAIGAAYGALRPLAPNSPTPVAAVALGLGAMAATDGVTTIMGNADPREWSASSWVMDVVFHLAYGAATAAGYEAFSG